MENIRQAISDNCFGKFKKDFLNKKGEFIEKSDKEQISRRKLNC
jgi:queuine/archaeosine tRNA-ribosyltransferase